MHLLCATHTFCALIQGYLARKKQPSPPKDYHATLESPAVGSQEEGVSYERGTPGRDRVGRREVIYVDIRGVPRS